MRKLLLTLVLAASVAGLAAGTAAAEYYYPWTYTTPVASCYTISQWYGAGNLSHHEPYQDDAKAVDIRTPYGTPIFATQDGWIKSEGWQITNGYYGPGGIMIRLDDNQGNETVYAHLSQTIINAGQLVSKNQLLGYTGGSGYGSTTYWPSHLHWAMRIESGSALPPDDIPGMYGPHGPYVIPDSEAYSYSVCG